MKEKVLAFLNEEIRLHHIPGAVIQVMQEGDVTLREAVGYRSVYGKEKALMTPETVFDLASLTKVVATLPAVLKLIDEGAVRLDDPVNHFLPAFATHHKEDVTLRHLLTHTSGLPAHRSFYKEHLTTEGVIHAICEEKLVAPIGSKVMYTDMGFILLYKIIEIVTGASFESFLQDVIFHPLNMTETQFRPDFPKERYALTEYSEYLNEYKCGIVHDENTESMGGISGHAGLFSTMEDLSKYVRMVENDGIYNDQQVLSKASLQLARTNVTQFDSEYRGLGWMLNSPEYASCGDYFSDKSYGHTGFTGTSIWFDPSVDLNVILLTNRVHYGRQPHIIRLRPRLHNLIRSYF